MVRRQAEVATRARRALAQRLRELGGVCDADGYVANAAENLLSLDCWEVIQAELGPGAGSELRGEKGRRPKFCAAHSSSALVVNMFGRWRNDASGLTVAGLPLSELRFEARCGAGVRGTAPHLDVLAGGSDGILGVESKCTEYLTPKVGTFSDAYARIEGERRESPWFQLITSPHLRSRFGYLDVAQLTKHYLGLAKMFPVGPVALLYLFWEPSNAGEFHEFRQHRQELEDFARLVANDRVEFKCQSYPELWSALNSTPHRYHVRRLEARYVVAV